MTELELAARFGIALGLGLLLGLERERSGDPERWAGVRTFSLIALLGATAAFLHESHGLTVLSVAVFLGLAALVVASYVRSSTVGRFGTTTEVSALLTFLVGLLAGLGDLNLASLLTVAALLLLALKQALHRFARRVEESDVEAVLKFAIITVIVLPLVPDRTYGPAPYDVINPFKIWLMVVLIAGLNFSGYVLAKLVGPEHGFALTGIMGGLVSSTAATLGFSQHSRREPELASDLALGILLAWTVMFPRVMVLVAVVAPPLLGLLAWPMIAMGAVCLIVALVLWRRSRRNTARPRFAGANPLALAQAVKFALFFGAVMLVARVAQVHLGKGGLYLTGALAGTTDVDAVVLSMANLVGPSPDLTGAAAIAIVISVLANTLVKAGMTVVAGSPGLRRPVLVATGLLVVVGVAAMIFSGAVRS